MFKEVKALLEARQFADLLDATRGQPLERAVHTGVLRCMAKACYETEPKGHFGLGLPVGKELAKLHKGDLILKDTLGGGCTFLLKIPYGE